MSGLMGHAPSSGHLAPNGSPADRRGCRNAQSWHSAILMAGLMVVATFPALGESLCDASQDIFLNPFNKDSAHHRPIGSDAQYAADDHPATLDWLQADSFNINVGSPWGVSVAEVSTSGAITMIEAKAVGADSVSGLPVTIPMPEKGFETKVGLNSTGNTDGVAVIYDRSTGRSHQLRQYNWNNGRPSAGQYKTWDIKGLGHGTRMGDRLGTSASGVAALFGILRGHEINTPGHKIQHALQMVLPRKGRCNIMLSRQIQLPAVSRDSSAGRANENTGNIPYGALLALPPSVNIASLGLSEPGRRLAEAIQDYGIYAVDGGGCQNGAIRTDQHVDPKTLATLKRDAPKIYRHIRMVLNNDVLGSPTAGGGAPRAPNCAFDAS